MRHEGSDDTRWVMNFKTGWHCLHMNEARNISVSDPAGRGFIIGMQEHELIFKNTFSHSATCEQKWISRKESWLSSLWSRWSTNFKTRSKRAWTARCAYNISEWFMSEANTLNSVGMNVCLVTVKQSVWCTSGFSGIKNVPQLIFDTRPKRKLPQKSPFRFGSCSKWKTFRMERLTPIVSLSYTVPIFSFQKTPCSPSLFNRFWAHMSCISFYMIDSGSFGNIIDCNETADSQWNSNRDN